MSLYVQTNVSSLNSQRRLNTATKKLDSTYQHLASGLRINSAKDDAAGLQISNRLTCQIDGLKQGNRNANDGIALCQTMEGALDETTSMLQRIRTLALQAANGTNTTIDRQAIQEEVIQLSQEITRIACKTTYAGKQCIAGVTGKDKGGVLNSNGDIEFQVGAYANDTLKLSMKNGFTLSGICKDVKKAPITVTGTNADNNDNAGLPRLGDRVAAWDRSENGAVLEGPLPRREPEMVDGVEAFRARLDRRDALRPEQGDRRRRRRLDDLRRQNRERRLSRGRIRP